MRLKNEFLGYQRIERATGVSLVEITSNLLESVKNRNMLLSRKYTTTQDFFFLWVHITFGLLSHNQSHKGNTNICTQ